MPRWHVCSIPYCHACGSAVLSRPMQFCTGTPVAVLYWHACGSALFWHAGLDRLGWRTAGSRPSLLQRWDHGRTHRLVRQDPVNLYTRAVTGCSSSPFTTYMYIYLRRLDASTLYRISFAALQKYHIDFGLINHSDILVTLSSFSKLNEMKAMLWQLCLPSSKELLMRARRPRLDSWAPSCSRLPALSTTTWT